MRKFTFLILLFLSFSLIYAQKIIENPEKPLKKDAGRILALKEEIRVSDDSGEFYFRLIENYGSIKVAKDGSFFVSDDNQLLKFSPSGIFIKNLIKIGHGPGEFSPRQYPHDFYLSKDGIYIFDSNARKIVQMDYNGKLINEKKLEFEGVGPLFSFQGFLGEDFVFVHQENVRFNLKTTGFYDLEMSIVLVPPNGKETNKIFTFPRKTFGSPEFGKGWAPFKFVANNEQQELFVYHSCEYQIFHADLQEGRILKSFLRIYPRVKHIAADWELKQSKEKNAPFKKYEDDISSLFLHKDNLWVVTSTKDDSRGNLIDLFDREGRYIDCFYFPISGSIKTIWNNYVFTVETDRDYNLQIVRYKIIG